MTGFTAEDVPALDGRTFLVTGANSGIGFEAAKVLAARGGRVLMACRDRDKAEAARTQIANAHPLAQTEFLPLDLADLASIRRAALIAGQEKRIDVLINNAGVMRPPLQHTRDGFELQFGINHLGHFALTAELLPKLAQGENPRVVTVASIAHRRGQIDFDNLDGRKGYNAWDFYAQSKLANALFFAELDRRLRAAGSPIASIGCHPGVAHTGIGRHNWFERTFIPLAGLVLNTGAQGAWPTLQAATDPAAKGGEYYGSQGFREMRGKSGLAERTERARDEGLAARLWAVSRDLTLTDPGLPPA